MVWAQIKIKRSDFKGIKGILCNGTNIPVIWTLPEVSCWCVCMLRENQHCYTSFILRCNMKLSYYCINSVATKVSEMLASLQFILFLSVRISKVRLFQYYLRVIVIWVLFVVCGVRLPEVWMSFCWFIFMFFHYLSSKFCTVQTEPSKKADMTAIQYFSSFVVIWNGLLVSNVYFNF